MAKAATIVVLEENAAAQELMDQALREPGHRVLVTNNPMEILALASRVRIDLLVGDVDRVASTDLTLAQRLRSIAHVLQITGRGSSTHADPESSAALLSPFSLEDLREAVAAALDRRA